jgi:hypothetical protein
MEMDETHANVHVQILKFASWTLLKEVQNRKMNMGTKENLQYLKINVD